MEQHSLSVNNVNNLDTPKINVQWQVDLFACLPGYNPFEGKRTVFYNLLLDSGADVTIIPESYLNKVMPNWKELPDAEFTAKVYGYGDESIEIVAVKLMWL